MSSSASTLSEGTKASLILISSVHWHSTWQRHHEIALGLSRRGYSVFFVEPLPKRWPPIRQVGRLAARILRKPQFAGRCQQREYPGIELVSPRLLPDVGNLSRWINRRLIVPRIADSLKRKVESRPLVSLNYLPISSAIELQRRLHPDLAIYDCVWDWSRDPFSRPGTIQEDRLVASVDQVFADSPFLFEKMKSRHRHVRRILPAVDVGLFRIRSTSSRHDSGDPLCAYFGQLGPNIDGDLIRKLSHRFRLRLIGPVEIPLSGFSHRTEVIGAVGKEALPQYLSDVDVLVLPYQRGGHTRGVIPAKTFECLATGIPTVAIGLPSLEEFGHLFYLCQSDSEFWQKIEQAAHESKSQREIRVQEAERNSWALRMEEIETAICGALLRRSRSTAQARES